MRILIIEDEYNLADAISTKLKKEKYNVDICQDGEEGLYQALMDIYDLIILDVMLPKMNGFDILKEIRRKQINTKIIMLTAASKLDDKLTGLENGANDYLTKPFHIEELIARINNQLRKDEREITKNYLELNDLRLNLKTSKLICINTNEEIELSSKEFSLMEYLLYNKDQIISKDQIYDKIWGIDNEIESNNLEAYISFLRKKIKIIGSSVKIKAIRGLGYKLEVEND